MSEQNKVDVQAVLNAQSLQEQLNKQKLKIKVDIDSAYLGNQIQSMVQQSVGNIQPVKIPIEADTSGAEKALSTISSVLSGTLSGVNLAEKAPTILD